MLYRLAADLVVIIHFAFVLFAIFGALLALKWPRVIYLHIPCALWSIGIALASGICPLTPFEKHLRDLAGQGGYQGSFVEHYIIPVLYPSGLTPTLQVWLGIGVFAINATIYTLLYRRHRATRQSNLQAEA